MRGENVMLYEISIAEDRYMHSVHVQRYKWMFRMIDVYEEKIFMLSVQRSLGIMYSSST